jgi:hypothetical protein
MPAKRPYAAVFVPGLAKKPPPDKLKEIWLWGMTRGNPMPSVFAPPNEGVDLATRGISQRFNYYADVFYGTDYETEFDGYYEADDDKELRPRTRPDRAELRLPQPVTPREHEFLREFAKLTASLRCCHRHPPSTETRKATAVASNTRSPAGCRMSELTGIIKKAAMEAFISCSTRNMCARTARASRCGRSCDPGLLKELDAAAAEAERVVIVSHSMGTMIAYDVLRNCPECPQVET